MLDLSNCEINILRRYSLRNLPALTEIHLHRNQISYLPDNLEASHLVYFDIANNDINSINNQTFTSLRSLRFLILSGNKLTTIDPSFFPQVVDLYIEDNPWLCDCDSLQQMYNWMIRTDQNVKQLKCQLPAKVEGLTWEEACYNTWSKVYIPQRSVWWYSLSFFITLGILLLLIYISKKVDERRKNEMEQQAEERRAVEQLEFIQRQQTRERLRRLEEQEESRNAPDPRESQGPPTYNEALLLPRLDASHPSLAGSLPSLSSIQGSNQDISKRRRQRRKRRRKRSNSSNPEPNGASNVNATDQSDNDRHTEMEESSF
ncbi:hypothetical protein HHI36_023191 [Cryptolaemus montrouzieri]|uniref:Uncharacterized protein n=1 Tax=Cryptolaemus montrouzieri TaxID=559131 RepID=A0ABD2PFW4_9CUCU